MKREISAHLATTDSAVLFTCMLLLFEANSFVSDFPHIDFFNTVQDIILCAIFLIISSKQFGYVVVTTLITRTDIFNLLFHYNNYLLNNSTLQLLELHALNK